MISGKPQKASFKEQGYVQAGFEAEQEELSFTKGLSGVALTFATRLAQVAEFVGVSQGGARTTFSAENMSKIRDLIDEMKQPDLKDPVLFLLACKVYFSDKNVNWSTYQPKVSQDLKRKVTSCEVLVYYQLLLELDKQSKK